MHLALVFPLGLYLPIHLHILAILICRLVDLSTCRPSAIVNNKDPVRVRVSMGLRLGLGLNVDIQIGTIMTVNEDPSPNLIGRQVDNSVLTVQINGIYRCRAAYPLETQRFITC